jgi:hypothetical protein
MTASTLPRHDAAIIAEPITPAELLEIADTWRGQCGDPGPARSWSGLSAQTGGSWYPAG